MLVDRFWVEEVKIVKVRKAGLTKILLDANDATACGSRQSEFKNKFSRWSAQYRADMLGTDFAGQWELMVCAKNLKLQLAVCRLGQLGEDGVRTAHLLHTYPLESASSEAPWVHLLFRDFGDCCGHFETTDIPSEFRPQPRTDLGKRCVALPLQYCTSV